MSEGIETLFDLNDENGISYTFQTIHTSGLVDNNLGPDC